MTTQRTIALLLASVILSTMACTAGVPAVTDAKKKPATAENSDPAPATASSPCGPVTARGVCQVLGTTPSVALVCNVAGNQLATDDCGSRGLVCTVDLAKGAICVTPPLASTPTTGTGTGSGTDAGGGASASPNTDCGTTTDKGICNGSVMKWCQNKKLLTTDCAYDAGYTCKVLSGEAKCVTTPAAPTPSPAPPPSPAGCGSVTSNGTCSGSTLTWCFNNQVLSSDCAYDTGYTCKMVGGAATCVHTSAPASECGAVTYNGTCEGTVMAWCQGGSTLLFSNCASDAGYTCQMIAGVATCVSSSSPSAPSGSGCVGVPNSGVCDGTMMRWCQGGTILESDCAYDTGYTCRMQSGVATCVN